MSRYIDADRLLNGLKSDALYPLVEKYGIERVIDAQPTADVVERSSYESMEHTVAKLNEALSNSVEVVRCKDCKHYGKFGMKCNKLHLAPIESWRYCSFGERAEK